MNVTVIIVSYNTYQLVRECYNSLRKFYPTIPCILIDGSDEGDKCHEFVKTRNTKYNKIFSLKKNIGHGPGMVLGIENCETDYFLLMDSDVVINKAGVIETMLGIFTQFKKLEDQIEVYGVGQLIKTNSKGLEGNDLHYLHPHFALIKKSAYQKCHTIINHGAPMLKAMKDVEKNRYSLIKFPLNDYITHHERGTRKLNPKAFHPKNWDKA